ncbi:MAG TPA: DUF397 domain-containing protein [Streptosporangiaceae bacterium]|jgi:hypothetical protein|nr:DUF397 domain-containing protein [Streptosporangiaceae bacterium]
MDTQDLRGAQWHISSYSANGATCVEVARNLSSLVAVRDSKDRQGPVLTVTRRAWSAFTDSIKHGGLGL